MTTALSSSRVVLITGANGNLGRKLVGALLDRDWCERVVAVDREAPPGRSDPRLFATPTPELELPGPRVGTDAETTASR